MDKEHSQLFCVFLLEIQLIIKENMKKIILPVLSISLSVLLAACGANSETEKTTQKESIESLKANEFIANYASNQAEYDKKYLDQAVTVSGEVVVSESMDEDGFKIEIKGAAEDETINCIFDKSALTAETLPELGSTVAVKGKCTGYTEEDMIGLKTITMVQCLIIE